MFAYLKRVLTVLALSLLVFTAASSMSPSTSVDAQRSLTPDSNTICRGEGCPVISNPDTVSGDENTVVSFIIGVARFLTFIGVALAILFMVWGGIRYITSNGSEDAGNGKQILINATIGLVVSIVAYTAVSLLANILQGDVGGNFIE